MGPGRHDVRDLSLADEGASRIDWAERRMPVLAAIRERFARERPLRGRRVSACLRVTAETASLVRTLQAGGADVVLCASDPRATRDDVAAALAVRDGVPTYAIRGEDDDQHFAHIDAAVDHRPQVALDDGADVIGVLHTQRREQLGDVVAATEQSATGVIRLRAMARDGVLGFPVVAVSEARSRRLVDDRHGSGQAALDAILRSAGMLVAGRTVVVAGYGRTGRGVAARARGLGARVVVCEVDPQRALAAALDGLDVLPMAQAASIGDIFCTATGSRDVIRREHLERMRDGVLLVNCGRLNVEIERTALRALAIARVEMRPGVEEHVLADGRRVALVGEGRPVWETEARPPAALDVAYANQALTVEYALRNPGSLERRVQPVPREVDDEVARFALASLGLAIDELSEEQVRYLESWEGSR
jgi:adenosylhomocysteinase